jgi:hypothetical protein
MHVSGNSLSTSSSSLGEHNYPVTLRHHVWYSSSVAVTIRRLADKDKGSISFNTLLEEIKTNPTVISRTRFKQLFVDGNYREYLADADFDRYVGLGKKIYSLSVVQNCRQEYCPRVLVTR